MTHERVPGIDLQSVRVPVGDVSLEGELGLPERPRQVVLFAHGSGSSRHSPRNRFVAGQLQQHGIATLLIDLLTAEEERLDQLRGQYRFDIDLLSRRLVTIVQWLRAQPQTRALPIGLFGASTGAAAALIAAADCPDDVAAVVSRGGRADLAGVALRAVTAPTLLIVGEYDTEVLELNRDAQRQMRDARVSLVIVPGATHLFEEPGALERVAALATDWFAGGFAKEE